MRSYGVGLLVVLAGLLLWNLAPAMDGLQAQSNDVANTRAMLERLDERLRANPGDFTVQIQFREDLIPGESTWTLGDLTDPYLRSITEIGDDYLCFGEAGGQSVFNRCTRFDNIVSINFFAPVE